MVVFFFNDTATTEIYTLSLHDALPISRSDVDVTDDMTRLTLDTIALAGFGASFHSFDQPELHPFLQAMGRALTEAMDRTRQRSEEHTSELQSRQYLVCRLLLEKKLYFD